MSILIESWEGIIYYVGGFVFFFIFFKNDSSNIYLNVFQLRDQNCICWKKGQDTESLKNERNRFMSYSLDIY